MWFIKMEPLEAAFLAESVLKNLIEKIMCENENLSEIFDMEKWMC